MLVNKQKDTKCWSNLSSQVSSLDVSSQDPFHALQRCCLACSVIQHFVSFIHWIYWDWASTSHLRGKFERVTNFYYLTSVLNGWKLVSLAGMIWQRHHIYPAKAFRNSGCFEQYDLVSPCTKGKLHFRQLSSCLLMLWNLITFFWNWSHQGLIGSWNNCKNS